jgi:cellulose biosynthesis protein BcsQ
MTLIVSTINLKGGVGKTATSVALAERLPCEYGKKVLLIDLDPQTNATIMLIGEDRWVEWNRQDHSLARLFKDAVEPGQKRFDFDASLQKSVSNVSGATTLDLLPASLKRSIASTGERMRRISVSLSTELSVSCSMPNLNQTDIPLANLSRDFKSKPIPA